MFLLVQNEASAFSGQRKTSKSSPARKVNTRVTVVTPCCRKPLQGVAIYVDNKESGQTSRDGTLDLALPPGEHRVAAPEHSNDPGTTLKIEPGGAGIKEVSLTVGSELYLFLTDFSFENEFKDAVMLCTSLSNIPDEADSFLGSANAPGCIAPDLDPERDVTTNFYPVTIVMQGTKCHDVLKSLEVNDADGRNFEANDDLVEWYEVFQDECLIDVLFTGTPLRLGYLRGRRAPRAKAGDRAPDVKPADKIRIRALEPLFTPASWDVRNKPPLVLPQLTQTASWRPSCGARTPLMSTTMPVPDPRLQKPRYRPSRGALGELDLRLKTLSDLFEPKKPPPKKMPAGFAERIRAMAKPRVVFQPYEVRPEVQGILSKSASQPLLSKKRHKDVVAHAVSQSSSDLPRPSRASRSSKNKEANAEAKPDLASSSGLDDAPPLPDRPPGDFNDDEPEEQEVKAPAPEPGAATPGSARSKVSSLGSRPASAQRQLAEEDAAPASPAQPASPDPPISPTKSVTYALDDDFDAEGTSEDGKDGHQGEGEGEGEGDFDSPTSEQPGLSKNMTYGSDAFEGDPDDDDDGSAQMDSSRGEVSPKSKVSMNKSQTYGSEAFDDAFEDGGSEHGEGSASQAGGHEADADGGHGADADGGHEADADGGHEAGGHEADADGGHEADEAAAEGAGVSAPSDAEYGFDGAESDDGAAARSQGGVERQTSGDDFEEEDDDAGRKAEGPDKQETKAEEFEQDDEGGGDDGDGAEAGNVQPKGGEFEPDDEGDASLQHSNKDAFEANDRGSEPDDDKNDVVSPTSDARGEMTGEGFDDFEEDDEDAGSPSNRDKPSSEAELSPKAGDDEEDAFEEDDDEESPRRAATAHSHRSTDTFEDDNEFEDSKEPGSSPKAKGHNDSLQSGDDEYSEADFDD